MNSRGHRPGVDLWFVLALGLGPLCWLALGAFGLAGWPRWVDPLNGRWMPDLPWRTLLVVVVASPVIEEIVFRGALQGSLITRQPFSWSWQGISVANLAASAVFAAFHLINSPPPVAAAVFLPSLVFGWSRDRYLRLGPGIALHAFYNSGFVLFVI